LEMQPKAVDSAPAAIAELRCAAAAGKPYSLMLLDQMMPEIDGFSLVEELRSEPDLAPTTVMMLASADRQNDAERCRTLGLAAYVRKPIKADELQIAILAALSRTVRNLPTSRRHERPADPTATASLQRSLRILVAEDDPMNRQVALYCLQKAGHTVVAVGNGKEALEMLQRDSFDAVLMDVQMPEMDGLEATAVIRANEARRGGHTPIVALTAHAREGDRERCLQAGIDDYVNQPIQSSELLRVIHSVTAATESAANSLASSTTGAST